MAQFLGFLRCEVPSQSRPIGVANNNPAGNIGRNQIRTCGCRLSSVPHLGRSPSGRISAPCPNEIPPLDLPGIDWLKKDLSSKRPCEICNTPPPCIEIQGRSTRHPVIDSQGFSLKNPILLRITQPKWFGYGKTAAQNHRPGGRGLLSSHQEPDKRPLRHVPERA